MKMSKVRSTSTQEVILVAMTARLFDGLSRSETSRSPPVRHSYKPRPEFKGGGAYTPQEGVRNSAASLDQEESCTNGERGSMGSPAWVR
jgi:hypothetical protein